MAEVVDMAVGDENLPTPVEVHVDRLGPETENGHCRVGQAD